MSQIPFISAFLISIALIGGATWFRLFPARTSVAPQVASVSQIEPFLSEDSSLEDFFNTETASYGTSTTPLSPPEVIGRQLFSDYMSLKYQGGVTPDHIDLLAGKYAEGIKNFEVSIPKVSTGQIVALPDSEENLAIYGQAIADMRSRYKDLVALQVKNAGSSITDVGSPAFSAFMDTVAQLYQSSADELLTMGVPSSLVSNHVELINNYLESAEVMTSLGNTTSNSIKAYSTLTIYAQHTGKESELLLNIRKVLMANGIIFNSSL